MYSGLVQRNSDKPVVSLWPNERIFFVQKAGESETSIFTNEYLYKKHKQVLRICPQAGKYKFWHLSRNFSAISRRSFSLRCKNHSEFILLPETIFPHYGLLETGMRFWQPAEFFCQNPESNWNRGISNPPPPPPALFVRTQTKRDVFDKPVENFPAKIRKLIAHKSKS